MTKYGICHLCKAHADLVDSDIIPRCFWKPIWRSEGTGKYEILSTDPDKENSIGQGSIRENLLCLECDQKLGVFDKYAREVLFGGVDIEVEKLVDRIILHGIDYNKMKLFQISILWRMGISSRQEFACVRLGSHIETLRQMILADRPGKYNEYGCVMIALLENEKQPLDQAIFTPEFFRNRGHICYRLVFGGCIWGFVVSSHAFPGKHLFLSEEGELKIGLTLAEDTPMLQGFADILRRQGKLP
jgi:hypothetical protein